MKERQLFLFLTFLPIAMAIFFWDLDTRLGLNKNTAPQQTNINEEQLPTTILENTRLTQYDISGLQSQRVESFRLLSNNFQKVVDIELPVITLETDDGLWVAKSITGEFNQIENRLSLFGEVTLTRRPTAQELPAEEISQVPVANPIDNPVQMATEQLDYYPEIRLAETTTPVIITTEGHYIESKGVRVDLTRSIYTLPERVRSRHEPL